MMLPAVSRAAPLLRRLLLIGALLANGSAARADSSQLGPVGYPLRATCVEASSESEYAGLPVCSGDQEPSWSPDGSRIAFMPGRCDPDPEADSCDFRLLIMKADGTGIRRLASSWEFYDPQPLRWSPDGKSLLMACGDRICVVDPTADRPPVPVSSPRTAEADWEASWSPDGRQIAFVRRYPNFCCPPVQPWSQLWVANADGSEPVLIGGGPGQELFTSPAWSPDGRLAYVRDYDDVWVSRADWTGARPIAQDLSGLLGIAGWSPDAATLYGGTSSGLWAIAADGARQALYRLTGGPMSVHAVSPAGRVGFVDGGRGPQTLRIAEVSFDSAREGVVATAMSPQALAWTTFSFSPDGSQIAYASDGECPTLIGLHVVRVDGGASPSVGDRREC